MAVHLRTQSLFGNPMSVNVESSAALHWLLSFPPQFPLNFIHMAQESSSNYWVKPSLPTQLNNIASIQVPGTDQIFAGVSLCCRSLDQKKKHPNPFIQPDLNSSFPQSTRFDQASSWLISDATGLPTRRWSPVSRSED